MTHREIIQTFYTAFAKGDAKTMASLYHEEIVFKDPAFGELKGEEARFMWQMLIEKSKGNLDISFSAVDVYDHSGSANWRAEYIFSATGRKVVNRISASFKFKDGKIIKHTDEFDLWRWARQAMGFKGFLLGKTSFFQKKLQEQSRKMLKSYIRKQNEN